MTNSAATQSGGSTRGTSTRATRQYALAGILFGAVFPIVATAIRLAQAHEAVRLSSVAVVQRSDPLLWIIDTAPLFLGVLAALAGLRQDALTQRNVELGEREQDLTEVQSNLEMRVRERTLDLERRNQEMRDAVLVTRRISRIGQAAELVTTAAGAVADMVRGYRVEVYLVDAAGTSVARVASSSGTGAQSRIPHEKIRVGDRSLVGQVAATGRSATTESGGTESEGTAHPGSMAIPLVVRGKVIGALSLEPDPSTQERSVPNVELLQLVADQLAATVDSSRLVDESRQALDQLQRLSGQGTQQAWRELLSRRQIALEHTAAGITPVSRGIDTDDARCVRASLSVRGQQIGSIVLRRDPSLPWTDGERELVDRVAAQAASALDNVRLLEDSVQRADKERRLSEITAKIGSSINMRNVLQTAVEELGRVLPGADVTLKLGTPSAGSREEVEP